MGLIMNGNDRFDLEQHILKCWNITDDLDVLSKAVRDVDFDVGETADILLGMRQLYEIKFSNLFGCFEELVNKKRIT